jgi:hypothetical protein
MLTARPEKYRGGRSFASVAANAGTAPACIYFPPASGGLVRMPFQNASLLMLICPISALPAFTEGLAVTAANTYPTWGPEYAPTGRVAYGQIAAAGTEGWTNATALASIDWFEVYQPNVFAMVGSSINTSVSYGLEFREFLSAEELQNWPSSRA